MVRRTDPLQVGFSARSLTILSWMVLVGSLGCASFKEDISRHYETVCDDPVRDEARAKELAAKGLSAISSGRWKEAEKQLQAALAADSGDGPAHNNLGRVYFAQRKYYLAAWELEYALELMPERAEPHNNLGLVYDAVDRLEQALEHFEIAYEMDPQNPEYLGNLVRTRLKLDDHDPIAKDLLQELVLIETRPSWASWARDRLGTWHGDRRPSDEAESDELSDEPDSEPSQLKRASNLPEEAPEPPPKSRFEEELPLTAPAPIP